MIMRIRTTVLALAVGAILAGGSYAAGRMTGEPASVRPATEQTGDGAILTDAMIADLAVVSPDTDPARCRSHAPDDLTIIITCDDATYLEWS